MTSPSETITVECPGGGHAYRDWYRVSLNLGFDGTYVEEASTATCPACGHKVRSRLNRR